MLSKLAFGGTDMPRLCSLSKDSSEARWNCIVLSRVRMDWAAWEVPFLCLYLSRNSDAFFTSSFLTSEQHVLFTSPHPYSLCIVSRSSSLLFLNISMYTLWLCSHSNRSYFMRFSIAVSFFGLFLASAASLCFSKVYWWSKLFILFWIAPYNVSTGLISVFCGLYAPFALGSVSRPKFIMLKPLRSRVLCLLISYLFTDIGDGSRSSDFVLERSRVFYLL